MSQSAPLRDLLWAIAQGRARFNQGASLASLLPEVLAMVQAQDRPTVQAMLYESMRHQARLLAMWPLFCPRQPQPLVTGLVEAALTCLWTQRYKDFVVVQEAVQAAKQHRSTQGSANFINALLRRYLRDSQKLMSLTDREITVQYNLPAWWLQKLKTTYPKTWRQTALAMQAPPPMTLRVNRRRCTPEQVLARWQEAGLEATRIGKSALMLHEPRPVHDIPGFDEGWVSVQDAGTQWATEWLPVQDGQRILDACAAPGGKTCHLLELANVEVTALEIDAQRTPKIHENLQRLGLTANVITTDALATKQWWDGQSFDAILLDAPCTASGVIRRQPDTPWVRQPQDIVQLAKLQQQLLNTLWPSLKPEGYLLYTTCSVFPEEGVDQIHAFIKHQPDAELVPLEYAKQGMLTMLAHSDAQLTPHGGPSVSDGFFYALLRKKTV